MNFASWNGSGTIEMAYSMVLQLARREQKGDWPAALALVKMAHIELCLRTGFLVDPQSPIEIGPISSRA
jgi:hypothetical protein